MLKVGIIGMGGIGNTHADMYVANDRTELVSVCDLIRERADKAASRLKVIAYYSAPEMLEAEDLDVVSVATAGVENGSDHFEPTMQSLEAGLHVLCEKPLCNEIDKAEKMVEKAREKGLCLGTDLNHRFVPPAARARKYIDDGELGELLFANMALWIDNANETSPYFHLRALHPHSIDVMRFFCGDAVKVQAFFTKPSYRKIWSNAQINMLFANGCLGHLTGSYDMSGNHPIERCEVAGTEGRFIIENVFESLTFMPRRRPERAVYPNNIFGGVGSFRDTFRNRINRFIQQVDEGASPEEIEASGADGLAAQKVIEAAISSFETGEVIDI
jgi:UDP-N-acetylglucosamine 3-dehydrogenase